ncbi:MAG: universal stress protein [Acidobacteriota bacterium]
MFEKLLVTTDLSDASQNIMKCLNQLKTLGAKEASLVHIIDVIDVGGLYGTFTKLLKPKMESLREMIEGMGYKTNIIIDLGNPAREINRIATEGNFSVIVAGTHGESLLKDVLLGSVVHKIIISAKKPILLIPLNILAEESSERCKALCGEMLKNILFPTDFSDTAENAFLYLKYLAENSKADISLCHIQDKKRIEPYLKDKLEEFNKIDLERLSRLEGDLKSAGARSVEKIIDFGNPAKLITELANSGKHTMLVIGSQGRSFMGETFLGKVANYAVHHIDIPLLIVPPKYF